MSIVPYNPRSGAVVSTAHETRSHELDAVVDRATQAASLGAAASPRERRRWLCEVADALEGHRDELAALADAETALGVERLAGEVTRTANQLRSYGDVAVEGSYFGVTVDLPTPTTPGLVRVNRPLGPAAAPALPGPGAAAAGRGSSSIPMRDFRCS